MKHPWIRHCLLWPLSEYVQSYTHISKRKPHHNPPPFAFATSLIPTFLKVSFSKISAVNKFPYNAEVYLDKWGRYDKILLYMCRIDVHCA